MEASRSLLEMSLEPSIFLGEARCYALLEMRLERSISLGEARCESSNPFGKILIYKGYNTILLSPVNNTMTRKKLSYVSLRYLAGIAKSVSPIT